MDRSCGKNGGWETGKEISYPDSGKKKTGSEEDRNCDGIAESYIIALNLYEIISVDEVNILRN